MASWRNVTREHIVSFILYNASASASAKAGLDAAGEVATHGRHVFLGGGVVRHAATEQLAHGATDAGRARVAARQPARLLFVRLQPQQHVTAAQYDTSRTTASYTTMANVLWKNLHIKTLFDLNNNFAWGWSTSAMWRAGCRVSILRQL